MAILQVLGLVVLLLSLEAPLATAHVVQVHVLHRHGDRTPLAPNTIPTDHVDWNGLLGLSAGQLTGRGMNQAYALGQYLAGQYVGNGKLLNAAFTSKQVPICPL